MNNEVAIKTTWRHATPEITKIYISGETQASGLTRIRPGRMIGANGKVNDVTVNGKKYESVRAAAAQLNIAESRIYLEMRQKQSRVFFIDVMTAIRKRKKHPLLIDGIIYNGYSEASKATGLSNSTLRQRFKNSAKPSI